MKKSEKSTERQFYLIEIPESYNEPEPAKPIVAKPKRLTALELMQQKCQQKQAKQCTPSAKETLSTREMPESGQGPSALTKIQKRLVKDSENDRVEQSFIQQAKQERHRFK